MSNKLNTSLYNVVTSSLESNQNVYTSQLNDGSLHVRRGIGQFWSFDLSFAPMTRAQYAPVAAFLIAHTGQTFLIDHPQAAIQGIGGGTPRLNGSHAAGSNQLIIDGLPSSITGYLLAGDLIAVGTSNKKVYMITSNVDSNGSGQATADIFPNLAGAGADNESIVLGPEMRVLKTDDYEFKTDVQNVYKFSIKLQESF